MCGSSDRSPPVDITLMVPPYFGAATAGAAVAAGTAVAADAAEAAVGEGVLVAVLHPVSARVATPAAAAAPLSMPRRFQRLRVQWFPSVRLMLSPLPGRGHGHPGPGRSIVPSRAIIRLRAVAGQGRCLRH